MRVITISGGARNGKTCIAEELKRLFEEDDLRVKIVNYADVLKMICVNQYGWNGEKDETGRTLLQTVGARFRSVDQSVWVNIMLQILKGFTADTDIVLIPDTRYRNEIIMLRDCPYIEGPFTVKVERVGFDNGLTAEQKAHPSENDLNNWKFDLVVKNDGTLEDYLKQAEKIRAYYGLKMEDETPTI